jgi:hypothetical protein
MLLVGHGRVFPIVEKLAWHFGAFATGLVPFFIDCAVINRTPLNTKILYVKRFASADLAAVAALRFQVTCVTVNPTR